MRISPGGLRYIVEWWGRWTTVDPWIQESLPSGPSWWPSFWRGCRCAPGVLEMWLRQWSTVLLRHGGGEGGHFFTTEGAQAWQ
jgi:hypothetical protein